MILTSVMGQRSVTREVPRLTVRAAVAASTLNVEARTVDVVWSTGSRVQRGFYDPYWEELSLDPKHVRMGRLQSGKAPVLDTHRAGSIDDIIGVVRAARLEKGQGIATIYFDSGPRGEDAFRRVQEGTLNNLSVGYDTFKMTKVEDGKATIPVYRAVDWEPHEITFAPIGADAGAVTRSGGGMTPCEFIQENAMDPETETPANPNPAPSATTTTAAVAPALTEAVRAAEARAEARATERVLGIQRIGRKLGRPQDEVDKAIKDGTSLDAYRTAAIDGLADAAPGDGGPLTFDRSVPQVSAGADARDKFLDGAEAWLLERSGQSELVAEAAKNPKWAKMLRSAKLRPNTSFDPGEFAGLRMMDLARRALDLQGVRSAGLLPMDVIGAAFTARRSIGIGGAAATGDFPILLENTLNKVLLAQYAITPNTWSRFCKRGSVSDFRASKRYRKGSFGVLSKVNENGEFTNKAIPDGEKQSLTAATKGNIITLTRQAIINDDLSAFSSMATDLGMAAALTIESDAYGVLTANAGLGQTMETDGLALFHATHKNIGTGAALGSGAIDADRVFMASQTDPSGNQILSITPTILIVPIGLEGTAKQINNGAYDFDSTKFQIPNKVGGLFRDIIGTARLTGTRRYLLADPAMFPTIEVAFLDGQEQPFLDVENGWRTDGVEWKVRMDYGVAPIDFRGAVTNAGV